MDAAPPPSAMKPMVWWIVWGGILFGLVVLYVVFGRGPIPPVTVKDTLKNLAGVAPLFVSIVIRWLVLPRFDSLARAFPMFVAGLALAEGCGILGLFLGGPYRDALFALGVIGVVQFIPIFLRQITAPKGKGYVPNN